MHNWCHLVDHSKTLDPYISVRFHTLFARNTNLQDHIVQVFHLNHHCSLLLRHKHNGWQCRYVCYLDIETVLHYYTGENLWERKAQDYYIFGFNNLHYIFNHYKYEKNTDLTMMFWHKAWGLQIWLQSQSANYNCNAHYRLWKHYLYTI